MEHIFTTAVWYEFEFFDMSGIVRRHRSECKQDRTVRKSFSVFFSIEPMDTCRYIRGCMRFHEACIIYILAQSRVALKELLLKNHVASQLVV